MFIRGGEFSTVRLARCGLHEKGAAIPRRWGSEGKLMGARANRAREMSVAVVILTYNRKDLLRECLQAIMSQTRAPDEIIVTDNACTDGTDQLLRTEFPQVTCVRLPENIGAAGGFHEGLKYAHATRHTWLWVMDDDGKPAPETLGHLLDGVATWGLDLASPLVLDIASPDRLAFPLKIAGAWTTDVERIGREPILPEQSPLFNGVLMRSALIADVGLPDKRLFIRGDEVEYGMRLIRRGIKRAVLTKAIFYHPSSTGHLVLPTYLFGARGRVGYTGSRWKDYFIFRNTAYINRNVKSRQAGMKSLIASFMLYSLFFLLVRRADIRGYLFWLRATLDGLRGKLEDPKTIMARFT
jgi:rhamnopyranosyl-N-acetylglucosaminyl-diphospho-decaprenol beta-1,3/1,4-galactofuranosyltransferase